MNREVMEKTSPFWGYKGSQKVLRNGQKMTPKIFKNNQIFVLRKKKHKNLIIFENLCKFILFAETDDFAEIVHCNWQINIWNYKFSNFSTKNTKIHIFSKKRQFSTIFGKFWGSFGGHFRDLFWGHFGAFSDPLKSPKSGSLFHQKNSNRLRTPYKGF